MRGTFRQSMAWLHTWAGLLLAWVLYFMFVTGTLGYFDTEIDRWMTPELPPMADSVPLRQIVGPARLLLEERAPGAGRWTIIAKRDRNDLYPRVLWFGGDHRHGSTRGSLALAPRTGLPLENLRETGGGQRLYRMHWKLHYLPSAVSNWLVGVATLFMLVALVTGVVIHRKIFKDFFTFRPAKGARSWLDAHNLTSVISLPFQLMITYSGLIFMMFIYMPLIVAAFYQDAPDIRQTFTDEVFNPPGLTEPAGEAAELFSLEALVERAESGMQSGQPRYLDVRNPGDANARVIISSNFAETPLRSAEQLVFDGVTGELIATRPAVDSAAKATRDMFLGLHEGLFADLPLRWLYVVSGLLGAGMIASGCVLWTRKRSDRARKETGASAKAVLMVEKLNVGIIMGLPVAIAAYFAASRLIPAEWEGRADWEVHVMFVTWLGMLVHALCRRVQRSWSEQALLLAAVTLSLPPLNALTSDRHLGNSLMAGDWPLAGFDLSMLATGLISLVLAQRFRRPDPGPSKARAGRSRSAMDAAPEVSS